MEVNYSKAVQFKIGCIDFTAGSLGGVALVYVSQPLDTVKVKMQTFPKIYKGMLNCLMVTFKKDGIVRGLYAGTTPAIVANVAENSVLFAGKLMLPPECIKMPLPLMQLFKGYGACQKLLANIEGKQKVSELGPLSNATAGVMASFFSTFTLCPTELVKCKLQALREMNDLKGVGSKNVSHITPFQLTKQILRTEGVPGLFRGLTSTMMREMPGYFCFFGSYEGTREFLTKPGQKKDDIGLIRTMIAGSVGGITLWTVIFPADVIKSRIQIGNINEKMLTIGAKIIKEEGVSALYNGLKPTIVRTIPATAVLFVVYEYTKKFLTGLLI